MAVKKKPEEQELLTEAEQVKEAAEVLDRTIEEEHYWHHEEQKARYINSIKKLKQLDVAMIDKALSLLEAAGNGSDEYKIKQIEKAIEIYQAVKYL